MRLILPESISTFARRSAKVVLPAPGVATAMKSLGSLSKYKARASACQARSFGPVPHAARSGYATGSLSSSGSLSPKSKSVSVIYLFPGRVHRVK